MIFYGNGVDSPQVEPGLGEGCMNFTGVAVTLPCANSA